MKAFRTIVIVLIVLLAGAVASQWLSIQTMKQFGEVSVAANGMAYHTSLPHAGLLLFIVGVLVILIWKLICLPYNVWNNYRHKKRRNQLIEGLIAFQYGLWNRAEKLLINGSKYPDAQAIALSNAVKAALQRNDEVALQKYLEQLAKTKTDTYLFTLANVELEKNNPAEALQALSQWSQKTLPPEVIRLKIQAYLQLNQALKAYELLSGIESHSIPSGYQLLEKNIISQVISESNSESLPIFWKTLNKKLRLNAEITAVYAKKAADLHLAEIAKNTLEESIEADWDSTLIALYGELPIFHIEERRNQAQQWLKQHPNNSALLTIIGKFSRELKQFPYSRECLFKAISQGAGSLAWEELGYVYTEQKDQVNAMLCLKNALLAARGIKELVLPTSANLKQKILDTAAIEERDEHGMPRLIP